MRMTTKKAAVAVVLLGLVVAACSGGDEDGAADTTVTMPASGSDAAFGGATVTTLAAAEAVATAERGELFQASLPADERVIRTADLSVQLQPGEFDQAWSRLSQMVTELGGYVGDATTRLETIDGEKYTVATATARIPAERFDAALARFDELGERTALSISGQDVSEEFIDLRSRLTHWQAQEAFYLELMEEATTIDESIRVKNQLDSVQLTIEQIRGRLNFLESRTELSTVTLRLTEVPGDSPVGTVGPDPEPGTISQALERAQDVLLGIVGFAIIAVAAIVPVTVLALVGYGVWRFWVRAARRPAGATDA